MSRLDKPIITQVSRLDPWKDPEGVIDVFKIVKEQVDCRLMLCYNVASDDPEGLQMYKKVQRKANKMLETGDILMVVGNSEKARQRGPALFSDVIIQKSTQGGLLPGRDRGDVEKHARRCLERRRYSQPRSKTAKNGYLLEPRRHRRLSPSRIVGSAEEPR